MGFPCCDERLVFIQRLCAIGNEKTKVMCNRNLLEKQSERTMRMKKEHRVMMIPQRNFILRNSLMFFKKRTKKIGPTRSCTKLSQFLMIPMFLIYCFLFISGSANMILNRVTLAAVKKSSSG